MTAIRPARPEDAGAIAAIYAPHVERGTATFEIEPPDAKAMRGRMGGSDGLYPWLVATNGDAEGGVLGFAYAAKFRERAAYLWTVETTIYMADASQGRGLGRQLYDALLDTLKAQGFTQAISTIALPNDPSIRLHEASGFRRAGFFREVGFKRGQWIDVGYWQVSLAEPAIPPEEPRKFSETGMVWKW